LTYPENKRFKKAAKKVRLGEKILKTRTKPDRLLAEFEECVLKFLFWGWIGTITTLREMEDLLVNLIEAA